MDFSSIQLEPVPGTYAVAYLGPDARPPDWAAHLIAQAAQPSDSLICITRTDRELSVVAPADAIPHDARAERGFRALRTTGALVFDLVGLIAKLSSALADAEIPVFVVSTFETDYILIRKHEFERACGILGIVNPANGYNRPPQPRSSDAP